MSLTLFSSTISSSKIGTSDTARMLLLLEQKETKINNNEIRTNYFSQQISHHDTITTKQKPSSNSTFIFRTIVWHTTLQHWFSDYWKEKNTYIKNPNNIIDCETEKTESEWRHFSCSKQDNEFIMAKFVLILIFKFELLFY